MWRGDGVLIRVMCQTRHRSEELISRENEFIDTVNNPIYASKLDSVSFSDERLASFRRD